MTSANQIGLSIRNIFTSLTFDPPRDGGRHRFAGTTEFADLRVNSLFRRASFAGSSRSGPTTNYEAHLRRLEIALPWPSRGGGGILLDVSRHQEDPRWSEVNGQWPHGDVNQLTATARCNKERRASPPPPPVSPPISRGGILR